MNRAECLDGAKAVVLNDRNKRYGEPEDLFSAIAARWSLTLGIPITAAQVALCSIDVKMARACANPGHADSWLDIAGYAACGAEIATKAPGEHAALRDPRPATAGLTDLGRRVLGLPQEAMAT